MTMDWDTCPTLNRLPEILGGTLVFLGARVPAYLLFEYL